ncbi:MAG: hypothetical protein DRQ55_05220 [Planctomycetota bacterium]|nr:MAG: hypothetical protein DRQ55_05220 [Planctomycetota bacterium]
MNRHTLLASVAFATLSVSLSAQSLTILPAGTWASDITPDGRVVVGSAAGGGFYWDWKHDPAPTFITGGNDIVAVSDDGLTMVGCMDDPGTGAEVAAMWTQASGWVSLGYLPNAGSCPSKSNAYDISGDGTTVVGLSWDGCSGRAFKWTAANGMEELQHLGSSSNRASAISGDGSTIGGWAQTSARSPAYWDASDHSGAMVDPSFSGEVHDLNADGSISVGTNYFGGGAGWYSAFYRVGTGNLISIGSLSGGTMAGNAQGVSEDGSLIVGFDHAGLYREAWIWTQASGIVGMADVFTSLGITGAPFIKVCRATSSDGGIVVGGAEGGGGGFSNAGFILEFDTNGSWDTDTNALAGTLGEPSLTGSGDLLPFAPVSISLSNALPGGQAWLIIGFSSINVAFKHGVLVPNPDLLLGPLGLSGTGTLDLNTFWPDALPGGFSSYYQYWIPDAAGPTGFAASNGLVATTP